jgi:alanine dehydrogenase
MDSSASVTLSAPQLITREKLAPIQRAHTALKIGIPKEKSFQENRVALTPEAVSILVNNGHEVVIESKAGEGGHFYDTDYAEAGAQIALSPEEVFKSEIIIKVAPLTNEELEWLKAGQVIISAIHLPTLKSEHLEKLVQKKVTALAFEYIKDSSNTFPIVRSMSEIAGNASILIASEILSSSQSGKGTLLGGITGVPPAKVVILGAGVVGEYASRTALGLGAEVKVFDNSTYKLMRLQNNIGVRVFTSIVHPDILLHELRTADVAIGSIHSESGRAAMVVTEEMVQLMKSGSVIVDVSIDQGGCFETSELTTHKKPTFKKYDVTHYCVPNIASRFARTASYAISNVLTPKLLRAGQEGGLDKLLWSNDGTRHGIYIYKGSITNRYLSEKFGLKFTDLGLLFTASNM